MEVLVPAPSGPLGWFLVRQRGINPATQFLGTTDAQPLLFKVNNIPQGLLHHSNFNTAFGLNALLSNTTGTSNVAIGYNSLKANTTSSNLTALGFNSLQKNISGIIQHCDWFFH
jgi:hypothetical protein